MNEFRCVVPTYLGNLFPEEIARGEKDEFGDPEVPVLIRMEGGVRIVLGTHDYDDNDKPDIKIERRPKGWAFFLHPSGATDPSGYVYFLDDGRSFLINNDFMIAEPIKVLEPQENVPEIDEAP